MMNTVKKDAARQYFGLVPLKSVDDIMRDARRSGMNAERDAKKWRKASLQAVGAMAAAGAGIAGLLVHTTNEDKIRENNLPTLMSNDSDSNGIPDRIPTNVTHIVKQDENPYVIAEKFNADQGDALEMAKKIQADSGNGHIHPGQVIQITPPAQKP